MNYNTSVGFDRDCDAMLNVSILDEEGEHLRYLDEDELEALREVVDEWLEKNRPLADVCACGAKLDSRQQCEREEECPEAEAIEDDIDPAIELNPPAKEVK